MKLILENAFTWDGVYGLLDESGKRRYLVDARIEASGRIISVCDENEKELGRIKQKKEAKRPEYEILADERRIGKITRKSSDYDIDFLDWFVSGDLVSWNFRVVDKHGDVALSSIENECLAFNVQDRENALAAALLLLAVAGLTGDLCREFRGDRDDVNDIHDVIDTVEGIASKTAKFGKKTLVAIEKLYDVYEEPSGDEEKVQVEKKGLHEVVDGIENVADKAGEIGHKTMNFLEHLYGLDDKEDK